jgi:hypothetical protein
MLIINKNKLKFKFTPPTVDNYFVYSKSDYIYVVSYLGCNILALFDKNLNQISEFKYSYVYSSVNSIIPVVDRITEKEGYIDEYGNEICDLIYDDVKYFFNGLGIVKLNAKYGLLSINGELVMDCKFDEIIHVSGNYYLMNDNIIYHFNDNKFELIYKSDSYIKNINTIITQHETNKKRLLLLTNIL